MNITLKSYLTEFLEFVQNNLGANNSWYAGITNDPKRRLFEEHNVSKDNDVWMYKNVSSNEVAREIEYYLVNQANLDGGTGGGDESSTTVYIYKKTVNTKP